MKKNKQIKKIKKAFYKGRTQFKRLVSLMLVGGIVLSLAYFCRYAFLEYAASSAYIVLSYPEIAQSSYPDGSRFVYYDFVSDEKLEAALDIMQEEGKYENLTIADLKDHFYVYSHLDDSASAEVSSARSEGNDFSYVANEYKITFIQPHDFNNSNVLKKLYTPDYSKDFLEALLKVNRAYIAEGKGGVDGFKILTDVDSDAANYDYDEKVTTYRTKIYAIIDHINALESTAPEFVSDKHNMSLKDIRGRYEILVTNKLDGIANFIESSGLTKDVEITSNKINVNIETNALKYNKYADRAAINAYAMTNYDHTFTENLINVVRDENQGLYQARPKTSFDTVVAQKNESQEAVAEYQEEINVLYQDMARYSNVVQTPEEYARLTEKCEALLKDFDGEYNALTATAQEIVVEYLDETNMSFVTAEIEKKGLFSFSLVVKLAVVFLIGAALMFVLTVLSSIVSDAIVLRRKLKLVQEIKQLTVEKGA